MSGRKRKADDDANDGDTQMSRSPSASPSISTGTLPQGARRKSTKRPRTNLSSRPLALPRLLETLSPDELRNLLKSICDRHPDLGAEVVSTAPRPNVESVLTVLNHYESEMRASFPFGGRETSDYAYNRVRQPLIAFLDSLKDYTPNFLPPNEPQTSVSLNFLDGVTNMIHRLPNWESFQHNRHKHEAYEEIGKAWAITIREAAKRGGGIQLQIGGWEQKLAKHHETSGNRMEDAMEELRSSLGWIADAGSSPAPNDPTSIRQQLLSGTYGVGPVRVGPW